MAARSNFDPANMLLKVYKSAMRLVSRTMLYKKYAALHAHDGSVCNLNKHDECAVAMRMLPSSEVCQEDHAKNTENDAKVFNFAKEFQREFDAAIQQDNSAYSCVSSTELASACAPCLQSDMRAYLNTRDSFFSHMLSVLVEQETLASQKRGYVEKSHQHLQHTWTCIINDWWQRFTLHDEKCYPQFPLLP